MQATRTRGAAIALALAVVLTACATSDPADEPADVVDTDDTNGEDAAGDDAADDPAPAGGGELIVAMPGDIDNFDAHTNQLIQFEWVIRSTVFDRLVTYSTDLEVVPQLAASIDVNDDASEFTFTLVDGATFHDGEPVDADAVIASLERAAGADSVWAPRLELVESLDAPDDSTVVVTLSEPYAPFLDGLVSIAILSPESFDDAVSTPVGSGPYRFVEWLPNERIVLEANDAYWGPTPALDRIEFRPIPDAQVAYTNLQAGEIHVIADAPISLVDQLGSNVAGTIVEPGFTTSTSLLELMGTTGALADVRVRQAIAHAFDHDAVRQIAYSGAGESRWSPLPSGNWAYVEQEGYPYDLDAASALLEEAGVEDLEITLEVLTGFAEAEQIGRVWQQSLAEIGVTLNIEVSELSVWLDRYVSRDYDLIWNFFNVSGDPHSYFDVIMRPHLADQYDAPEVLDLIRDAVSTSDEAERAEVYATLQDRMVEDLPVLIVQSRPLQAIVADNVSGFALNPLGWADFTSTSVG